MPVARNLEHILRQADQTPFATDGCQATQQEAAEPTCFFDLAKYRLHDDLPSRVQRLPCWRPQFRGHTLLRRSELLRGLRLRCMEPLAPGGDVRIEPQGL